jgi:HSP20 family protein
MTTGIMKRENGTASMPATSFSGLVDQLFQNNLNRFFEDDAWGFRGLNHNTSIPVNVQETDKTYEMQLVAPGLKKEDFKININKDLLTVSFEQKEESQQENKNESWVRKEYKLQSFTRSFNLDDSLDANKITAQYKDGILHLTLPKKEGAQRLSRNIEVK